MSDGPSEAREALESGGLKFHQARKPLPPVAGCAAGVLRQMKRVEEELNELVMTPGVDEPLAREAATISEALRNRRVALERMRHNVRMSEGGRET